MFGKKKTDTDIMTVRNAIEQISNDLRHEMNMLKGELNQIQLSIAFLQQMAWGVESKSIPPFMLGMTSTREHRDKPGEGIYKDTIEEAKERAKREAEKARKDEGY